VYSLDSPATGSVGVQVRALGGRYRLERPLGSGGMAVLWRAYDQVLGRPVAVKLLAPSLADRLSRERIRAEAQLAAKLAHPNVASVYDFGEARRGPLKRVPYIVMELVDGVTLANRLSASPMHWRTAVRIGAEVAAALAAAHVCGVVHCDVKPGNVMLARTGVKVVDFGIAAAAGDLTEVDGELLGTPAYVAPERVAGDAAVPASDVYALGVVLFQCLTGELPFEADSVTKMITAHRRLAPARLPRIVGLPDEVAELYEQCMSKSPNERPSSLYASLVLAEAAGVAVTLPPVNIDRDPAASNAPTVDLDARRDIGFGPRTAPFLDHASVGGRWSWGASSSRSAGRRRGAQGVAAAAGVTGVLAAAAAATGAYLLSPSQDAYPRVEAAALPASHCAATYQAEHRTGGLFTAEVALTNTGESALDRWSLTFALPQGQRVTDVGGVQWRQDGEAVTLRGAAPLAAGGTVRLWLTGTSLAAAAPTGFTVDGAACTSTASAERSTVPPAPGAVTGSDAAHRRPARSAESGRGNGSRDERPD
jgi:eukaryotic-like serine/threonine-protein kinase